MSSGHGYLAKNKISISWVSAGYKVLSLIITFFLGVLDAILIVYHKQAPFGAICFISIVLLLCVLVVFLSFNSRILVDINKKKIQISFFKTKTINFEEIQQIKIDTQNSIDNKKYCFVKIYLKNGEIYKFAEYSTLLKGKAVDITIKKIAIVNELLKNKT